MDSVDDISINYVAQPNCQGILLALVPWTTDADFVAIVRTLLSRYGIELVFFHGCRIIGLTLENLNWQKWTIVDFYKNRIS